MNVSELTGALLDYWVARAEQYGAVLLIGNMCTVQMKHFAPSTNWAHGGPIIERERIDVRITHSVNQYPVNPERRWFARAFTALPKTPTEKGIDAASICKRGPTPLVSAMRAYVASKYGQEVPDEVQA